MADPREDESRELDELATAIADRTPVDWDAEFRRAPARTPALSRLREIAQLQAVHARLREAESAPEMLFAWGPLQVVAKLGEGSFAEVFLARDPALQREVALKLRHADLDRLTPGSTRWLDEARRLARVRHPNVLLVHGADVRDGRSGIWTERVRGVTLEDWLAGHGTRGPREAAGVVLDLCGALAAVHAAGLVHGDVSTRNVMREGGAGASPASGRIVLMDFGSAHEVLAADLFASGTPLFAAPEVLAGGPPTVASDVYSLGVVFFRLLTARWPAEGESLAAVRESLARGDRNALRDLRPDLPADLVRVVERACEPDPAKRFASPAELERALAAVLSPAAPAPAAPRRANRLVWAAAAALVGVVAFLVVRPGGVRTPAPAPDTAVPGPRASVGPATGSPPAAPVVPPPAPAAPDVESRLVRIDAGIRSPLRNGDMVAPGDQLALELESPVPLHVYVLNEDDRGAVVVLFPLRERGAGNPVPGRVPVRLPGGDRDPGLAWQVTSAGGRERFLILGSEEPLAPVADAIASLPVAGAGGDVRYPTLSSSTLAKLRSTGGIVRTESLPPAPRGSMLAALARDLSRPRPGHPIWMRMIVLENPVP